MTKVNKNKFGKVYLDSYKELYKLDLSKNELKVVLLLIAKLIKGNLINISQIKIAKELEVDRANISRTFKNLKEKKILIDDDGDLYLNKHVVDYFANDKLFVDFKNTEQKQNKAKELDEIVDEDINLN